MPPDPDVIVSHGASLVAVHEHPAVVVTVTGLPAPPAAPIEPLPGAIEYVHGAGAAADCVTLNLRPAIVSSPVRSPPVLAATVNATLPLPLPEPPEVIVSHDAPLVAVHEQPSRAVTLTVLPSPPLAPIDWLVGAIVNSHEAPA